MHQITSLLKIKYYLMSKKKKILKISLRYVYKLFWETTMLWAIKKAFTYHVPKSRWKPKHRGIKISSYAEQVLHVILLLCLRCVCEVYQIFDFFSVLSLYFAFLRSCGPNLYAYTTRVIQHLHFPRTCAEN